MILPQTIFLLTKSLRFDTLSAINNLKLLSVKIKCRNGLWCLVKLIAPLYFKFLLFCLTTCVSVPLLKVSAFHQVYVPSHYYMDASLLRGRSPRIQGKPEWVRKWMVSLLGFFFRVLCISPLINLSDSILHLNQ